MIMNFYFFFYTVVNNNYIIMNIRKSRYCDTLYWEYSMNLMDILDIL